MSVTLREFFEHPREPLQQDIIQAFYNVDSQYKAFKDRGVYGFDPALTDAINEATARFYQLTERVDEAFGLYIIVCPGHVEEDPDSVPERLENYY